MGGGSLERPSLGTGAQGLASPPGRRSRPEPAGSAEEPQEAKLGRAKWGLLAMLPSSKVDAFEVQIEELLIAVHRVAREGLVAGPTW